VSNIVKVYYCFTPWIWSQFAPTIWSCTRGPSWLCMLQCSQTIPLNL